MEQTDTSAGQQGAVSRGGPAAPGMLPKPGSVGFSLGSCCLLGTMAHPKSVVLHPQRDTAQSCDLLAKALGAACKQGADSPGQNAASLGCHSCV